MTAAIDVAFDIGQSSSRAAQVEAGRPLDPVRLPPMSYDEADPVAQAIRLILAGLAEIAPGHGTGTIAVGLTTLLAQPELQGVAEAVRQASGAERVVIVPDVVVAHAGALAGEPGVVLSFGTGSVALAIDMSGAWSQLDGAGFLLGDDGGGFWLGRAGLALALQDLDGRADAPALSARLRERFGDAGALLGSVYRDAGAVAQIAGFCADVVDLAEAGDAPAMKLVDASARLAARTVNAGVRLVHPGPVPVSVVGGLTRSPLIVSLLRIALDENPRARWKNPNGDGLAGAALLTARGAEQHLGRAIRELGVEA